MIRPAEPADIPDILRLIKVLADYERSPESVVATEDDLRRALFPESGTATAHAHVAVVEQDGVRRVAGMALWFVTFSTWTGRNGIWLEDLIVEPDYRGHGLGIGLLTAVARVCVARGYARMDWSVLDWNAPSIDFYQALGATPLDEWTTYRLDGERLERVGTAPL